MHVLNIFITGDICSFGHASLLMSPEIGRNSCLRHVIGNYLESTIIIISCNVVNTKYFWENCVVIWYQFAIPCLFTLMFIPVVLAILTRNKRRMSIPKQHVAVNHRFNCAHKTPYTVYSLLLIFLEHCSY